MADKNSTIPKGWKMTTLGEVGFTITGKTPSKDNPEDWGNFLDFITPTDISSDSKYLKNVARRLSEEGASRFKKMTIPSKSVVVSCIGSDMGKVVMNENEALTNQQINSIKINSDNDKDFIFYLLKNSYSILRNIAVGGSTMPILNKSTFESLEFLTPSFPEQRAIAAVLSSLDDKIELLREQNKTLEAIAQAIFKEWFVNFNFPGATGKMIDSELGEIPEGWRVGKIKDLIDILSGFAFSSSDFSQDGNYKLVTIKNVQDRHFDPETKDRLSALPVRMPEYCKLNSGDILLSLTGNVGRICLVNGDNFLLNQRVAKLKEKNPSDYAFTYLLFLQDSIFSLLQSTASGTAQQNLSPIQTKEIEIIIADRKTLDQFGMVANKLIQKINDNNSQVETLSKLRDTLLPKLMTGNVRVKGFED